MAVAAKERVEHFVTSQTVLTEVLDGFADKGEHLRKAVSQTVDAIIEDENIQVTQTGKMFERAFSFYKDRPDKEWQLTDCASFLIMQKFGLSEALTGDHHFEQEQDSSVFLERQRDSFTCENLHL